MLLQIVAMSYTLTLWEEDVLIKYLLQMSNLGQTVRMKLISSIAFRVTRHRPLTDRPLKPPVIKPRNQ
jgi:hypothetical protein